MESNKETVTISFLRYTSLISDLQKALRDSEELKNDGFTLDSNGFMGRTRLIFKNEEVLDKHLIKEINKNEQYISHVEKQINDYNSKSFIKRLFTFRIKI